MRIVELDQSETLKAGENLNIHIEHFLELLFLYCRLFLYFNPFSTKLIYQEKLFRSGL